MTISKSTGTSKEWTYTKRPLSSFPEAKDEYEGFCPILPERLKGISDFDAIRSATKTYITKHRNNWSVAKTLEEMGIEDPSEMTDKQIEQFTAKQAWTFLRPNTDKYWQNVADLRNYFKRITGAEDGFVQPMRGDVVFEIDIVCPNEQDKAEAERRAGRKIYFTKLDIDNCLKPVFDALDFRAKTNEGKDENGRWKEGKKLGLVVDDKAIVKIIGKKHDRREGEQTGFYWRIRRADGGETDPSVASREMANKYTSKFQQEKARLNAGEKHTDHWEDALNKGFSVTQRTAIRLSLLTNDETPLDPVIAEHYLALRHFYDRNASAALVFEEQNSVSSKRAFGMDAEGLLCEIEQDVDDFRNNIGIEVQDINEATSIRQLDAMPIL